MKVIKALCLILALAPIFIEYDNESHTYITPLHQAASDGDIEQVKKLISGSFYVNSQNMVGNTPLHLAAQNGHMDIVELLLAGGAGHQVRHDGRRIGV